MVFARSWCMLAWRPADLEARLRARLAELTSLGFTEEAAGEVLTSHVERVGCAEGKLAARFHGLVGVLRTAGVSAPESALRAAAGTYQASIFSVYRSRPSRFDAAIDAAVAAGLAPTRAAAAIALLRIPPLIMDAGHLLRRIAVVRLLGASTEQVWAAMCRKSQERWVWHVAFARHCGCAAARPSGVQCAKRHRCVRGAVARMHVPRTLGCACTHASTGCALRSRHDAHVPVRH